VVAPDNDDPPGATSDADDATGASSGATGAAGSTMGVSGATAAAAGATGMSSPQASINPSTLSAGSPAPQMSFAASDTQMSFASTEMQILNEIGSLISSMGATSTSGTGTLMVDVLQLAKDILGAIGNPTPQSGGGASPAVTPDPTSGSLNLGSSSLNLDQSSSTANPVVKPPGT